MYYRNHKHWFLLQIIWPFTVFCY